MNLFINDNFFDTVDNKVNVLQLIRHVADDDEVIESEVIAALREHFAYDSTDALEEDIRENHFSEVTMVDDSVYACGEALIAIFEDLFPDDYTAVITAIANQLMNASGTLKLDHNGVPVTERPDTIGGLFASTAPTLSAAVAEDVRLGAGTQQHIADPVPEGHVITAIQGDQVTVQPVQVSPFQGIEAEPEVLQPTVATLSSEAILGELKVDGRVIPVRQVIGKNGVLFDVGNLYYAVYNLQHDREYFFQLLVEYRASIDPEDVLLNNGTVYLTAYALAKLHGRLCHLVEWQPLVAVIVKHFTNNPYENAYFDLLGNLAG